MTATYRIAFHLHSMVYSRSFDNPKLGDIVLAAKAGIIKGEQKSFLNTSRHSQQLF
jgi:hypothetical protein